MITSLYICRMKKKQKRSRAEKPAWLEEKPRWGWEEDAPEEEEEQSAPALVNEKLIDSFVYEYQPETDEAAEGVRALSIGELRDLLHIYRTFDSKSPDPLPFYLSLLEGHGFGLRIGFAGEQVMLVRRRNNGKGFPV